MEFNFSNQDGSPVEEATGNRYASPGTIAVFTIEDVKFDTAGTGTPFMSIECKSDAGEMFSPRFYMTEKSFGRVQALHMAVTDGQKLSGTINSEQLTMKFKGQKIALRVSSRVSDEGKVYADLPYGGFAKHPSKISELTFSPSEQAEIDRHLEIKAAAAGGDASNAPAASAPTGAADEF